jgi:hypothetical protein
MGQPGLAANYLLSQFSTEFSSHAPLESLEDRTGRRAIIAKLLGAIVKGNA